MSVAEHWNGHDFYRQQRAEDHFVTEPMISSRLAHTVAKRITQRWGRPMRVFDIGAGDGSLLRALAQITDHELHGVDIRPRPTGLTADIAWHSELPQLDEAVVICHELLDDIPCHVVEIDATGSPCLIVSDDSGRMSIGPRLDDPAAGPNRLRLLNWMQRWWPSDRPYSRVEIGLQRDEFWRSLLHRVERCQAFAIDYGHVLAERRIGTWDGGTMTGFRHGRPVPVTFSGTCNVTAHVAMDALAAASGTRRCRLTRQGRILGGAATAGWSTSARADYLWLEVTRGFGDDG